jgi:hypothetical protein
MKKFIASILVPVIALPIAGFMIAVYGPQTLVPPPKWPMTEDSRKQYQPFSEHSRLVVKTWVYDLVNGRIKP